MKKSKKVEAVEEKKSKTKIEKKVKKEAKKKEKKFKKLKKLVASELFSSRIKNDPIRESLIDGITKSVGVHKTLSERDKEKLRNSESFYYDDLFTEFKSLIKKHNDNLGFNADALMLKVRSLEKELKEKTELSEKAAR